MKFIFVYHVIVMPPDHEYKGSPRRGTRGEEVFWALSFSSASTKALKVFDSLREHCQEKYNYVGKFTQADVCLTLPFLENFLRIKIRSFAYT